MAKTLKQEPAEKSRKGKAVSKKTKKADQQKITDCFKVEKRKVDRFNGLSEEELYKRCLPDHLAENLDILIIGINPGLFAAYKGHHYAGPGNHFWKCLYLSGLIPHPMTADDDYKLIEYGIGFTNIVQRTTRGSAELKPQEIREGAKILLEKIRTYQPKIAVFNGKEIYRIFSGQKDFNFGKQSNSVDNTILYVMPSSSARCSQLPRALDKVPFYVALRKLRDHLRGNLPYLTESEITFSSVLVTASRKDGSITVKNESETMSMVKSELDDDDFDPGLDDDGRPILPGRGSFDLNLVKHEPGDNMNLDDTAEFSDPYMVARQCASQIVQDGKPESQNSTAIRATDISEGFNDYRMPNGIAVPCPPSSSSSGINFQHFVGRINDPATTSAHDGDETAGNSEANGDDGDDEQPQQESSGNASVQNHGDSSVHPQQAFHQGGHYPGGVTLGYPQQLTSQHVNGGDLMAGISEHQFNEGSHQGSLTPTQQPAMIASQRTGNGHRPSVSNLPPDVLLHVEEAIESVIQQARTGPFQMPTFRSQTEKPAAAQATQQQHSLQQQQPKSHQQPHHRHDQQVNQQQQQHQQQMFANLQLQAAAVAAAQAAQFDLAGRMKSSDPGVLSNYCSGGVGAAGTDQSNSGAAGLYQYFQQQQPHTNQGFGNSAFSGGGQTTNYGIWQSTGSGYNTAASTTTNSNQTNSQNLYNQAMTAQYLQNAATFGSYGGTTPVLGGFGTASPYFVSQQQQQQQQPSAASSIYGQYAGGFFPGMSQQQQQNQQQSPHNL